MIFKIKLSAVITTMLIIVSLCSIVNAQCRRECLFKVDTLFRVQYGESPNMLEKFRGNPYLFWTNNENTYVLSNDEVVLIFDRNGKFTGRKKIPFKRPEGFIEIISNKKGFVFASFNKIYYLDREFELTDSVDLLSNCIKSNQFKIYENIYFNNSDDNHKLIQFDTDKRLFSTKPYYSIWKTKSANCTVSPFPERADSASYYFSGASKKMIIAYKNVAIKDSSHCVYTLFNIEKCTAKDLCEFNYRINNSSTPGDKFQFVNDTTAVFVVRYDNNDSLTMALGFRERDCVFYRITFSNN